MSNPKSNKTHPNPPTQGSDEIRSQHEGQKQSLQIAQENSTDHIFGRTFDELEGIPHKADLLIGRHLGNYHLIERIGEGASAVVYRAEHTQLGIPYAVKILHPAILSRKAMRERFLREARAAGQLRHENVVFIADFAIDPSIGPYMVMEYLEGENLQSVLEREGALPPNRIRNIAKQICKALSVAHDAGIIHRDLKPENIFLLQRKQGEVIKILDFGIARLAQDSSSITGAGNIIGTPLYMSPEQCRGNTELNQTTDIYSFGVMLYQMLTGTTPFVGDNPQKLIIDHFLVPPPPLGDEFPAHLQNLQQRLLAKSPEERPQTMEAVWKQLARALESWITRPHAEHPDSETNESLTPIPSPPSSTWVDINDEKEESKGTLQTPPLSISLRPKHEDPSRQTLEFGSELSNKLKTKVEFNDPSRQTLEAPKIQRQNVRVEQPKTTSRLPQTTPSPQKQKDPLLFGLEQVFSSKPKPAGGEAAPTEHNPSPITPTSPSPLPINADEELLKDLALFGSTQPTEAKSSWNTNPSGPSTSSHFHEPTKHTTPPPRTLASTTSSTPSTTSSTSQLVPINFAPPTHFHSSKHFEKSAKTSDALTSSNQLNERPHSNTFAYEALPPTFSNNSSQHTRTPAPIRLNPNDFDADMHTEIEIASVHLDDLKMTRNEDNQLAQQLRKIEQAQRAQQLLGTPPTNESSPPKPYMSNNKTPYASSYQNADLFRTQTDSQLQQDYFASQIPNKSSSNPILWLLLLVLLAVLIGYTMLWWLYPSFQSPEETIVLPDAPHCKHVQFQVEPPGSAIFRQKPDRTSELIGQSPTRLCLPIGENLIRFQKTGYRPIALQIFPSKTPTVIQRLKKIPPPQPPPKARASATPSANRPHQRSRSAKSTRHR